MRRPTMPRKRAAVDRKLWQRMNEYIRQEGGWIVSLPDTRTIRFECQTDSTLPDLLRAANHDPRFLGIHERLLPTTITERRGLRTIASQGVSPGIVNVFTFDL